MKFLAELYYALPEQNSRRARILYELNRVINVYGTGTEHETRQALNMLKPVLSKPATASAHEVSAIGHAHMDVAWLWPLRETVRKISRTFATVLKLMDLYPGYKFGSSQAELYEMVKHNYPALYARIKKAVKEKKWEIQGGMWVEADCNITSGESLVRQVMFGKRFFKDEFNVDVDNLWLPDVFGYSAAMPQILKLAGINYFMTQKISWNDTNKFPYHTFMWEGIDGTGIFTHFLPADTYNGTSMPRELVFGSQNFFEKDRLSKWLYLFGWGDGGGGPSRHHIEFLRRAQDCEELPKVKFEFAKDYFHAAEKETTDLPLWKGELYFEMHRGTYTTHAKNKKMNRLSEQLLHDCELLNCYDPAGYPQKEINGLWKIVLLNQFHDILPGSSIAWVYRDSQAQYKHVTETANSMITKTSDKIAARIDTSATQMPGRPVVITNTVSWERDGLAYIPLKPAEKSVIVTDDTGTELITQKVVKDGITSVVIRPTVPASGHTVVHVSTGNPLAALTANSLSVTKTKLENDVIRVTFDSNTGEINGVYDKQTKKNVLLAGKRANKLSVYEDIPRNYDAWDIEVYYEETKPVNSQLTKSYVKHSGPVFASIVQERTISNSKIVQEIRLSAGSKRVEFHTYVKWNEKQKMLRTLFPVDVLSDRAAYEIQFGHLYRPTHRNTTWDTAKFEVCGHKWADLSEPGYGVALLNDCKYGHKIHKQDMELNLLRSSTNPDPDADVGEHRFSYALLPHAGDLYRSDVIRQAYEFNYSLRVTETTKHKGVMPSTWSFITVDKDNVILDTIKKCEHDNSVVLRFYETFGQKTVTKINLTKKIRKVYVTDLLERADSGSVHVGKDNSISLEFHPFEIKTIKLVL
jgi:alpha-mannosidase